MELAYQGIVKELTARNFAVVPPPLPRHERLGTIATRGEAEARVASSFARQTGPDSSFTSRAPFGTEIDQRSVDPLQKQIDGNAVCQEASGQPQRVALHAATGQVAKQERQPCHGAATLRAGICNRLSIRLWMGRLAFGSHKCIRSLCKMRHLRQTDTHSQRDLPKLLAQAPVLPLVRKRGPPSPRTSDLRYNNFRDCSLRWSAPAAFLPVHRSEACGWPRILFRFAAGLSSAERGWHSPPAATTGDPTDCLRTIE